MSPLCTQLAETWSFDGSGFVVSAGPGVPNPRAGGTCPAYIIGPCSGGSIAGGDMKYVPSCIWSANGTICQAPYPLGPPVSCSDPFTTGGLNSQCGNPNGNNSATYPVKWQASLNSSVNDGNVQYAFSVGITDAPLPSINACTQGMQAFNYTGTANDCTSAVTLTYVGTSATFGGLKSVSVSPPASVTIKPSKIGDGGSIDACSRSQSYTVTPSGLGGYIYGAYSLVDSNGTYGEAWIRCKCGTANIGLNTPPTNPLVNGFAFPLLSADIPCSWSVSTPITYQTGSYLQWLFSDPKPSWVDLPHDQKPFPPDITSNGSPFWGFATGWATASILKACVQQGKVSWSAAFSMSLTNPFNNSLTVGSCGLVMDAAPVPLNAGPPPLTVVASRTCAYLVGDCLKNATLSIGVQ